MPYLNVDLDFLDHPQTLRLVVLLGRGAEVLPIRLWSYCGKFHPEKGELTDLAEQEIEAVVKWWGKPGAAVAALVKTGYLEKRGEVFAAAHWEKHNGHIWALKVRSQKANDERWRELREKKALLQGTGQGVHKDNLGNPPSSRPARKEGGANAPQNGQRPKCAVTGCSAFPNPGHTQCPSCEQGVPV